MGKRSKKKTKTRFCEQPFLHDYMAKHCSKDSGPLHFFFIEHTWCKKILILGYVDKALIISPFQQFLTLKTFISYDLHIYLIIHIKIWHNSYVLKFDPVFWDF